MEIFILILPFLSFLLFQFTKLKISSKILFGLNLLILNLLLILSIYIFIKVLNLNKDLPIYLYSIVKLDYLFINWTLRFDLLVCSLMVSSTLIGLILSIYTISSSNSNKFNSIISLTILSFNIFITSNNLIQFFVGWYLIILSTFLISKIKNKIYIIDNTNIFIQNRISDLGFFLSLFFIYSFSNSINFDVILKNIHVFENDINVLNKNVSNFDIISFILFFSFLLRCRQFFIFNSIYDFLKLSMFSYILIIFGVFIPSGIFLILRFLPLNYPNLDFFNIIIVLGAVFTLIFCFLLTKTYNLKKLLTYIASCQFSIMVFLIGHKAFNAALFYFFTISTSLVMVCLIFEIVIAKLNGEQDIRRMGSLFIKTPTMFLFIFICFISLLGIPYFSGFYSINLIFLSLSYNNNLIYFLSILLCLIHTFMISYISFKIIVMVFFAKNNCNIHLYNKLWKINFSAKLLLFLLSIIIIFSGWYLNNLFYGLNAENLWKLVLLVNTEFTLDQKLNSTEWILELRNMICYLGIILSVLNYLIIPKFENNIKLKNNILFKNYVKFFIGNFSKK